MKDLVPQKYINAIDWLYSGFFQASLLGRTK